MSTLDGAVPPAGAVSSPATHEPLDVRKVMRETSHHTTVVDLARRGISRVKIVDSAKIHAMVAEAVERVILEARDAALVSERGKLELAARREFQALLQEHQEVVRSREDLDRQKTALAAQLAQIEARLTDERKRVVDGETFTISDEGFETLDVNVRLLFADLLRSAREDGAVPEPVLARMEAGLERILDHLVGDERRRRANAEKVAQSQAIEILERRIQKLNTSLSETERRLQEVAAAKGYDSGVASIYDQVQGLNPAEAEYERKKGLLKLVFEENLSLQRAG